MQYRQKQHQMFQNENKDDANDDTTINFQNYQLDKVEKPSQCQCNPIVSFMMIGMVFIYTAFFFIVLGVVEIISTLSAKREKIAMVVSGGNFVLERPIFMSFVGSQNIAVYLRIQKLTQFDHIQQIRARQLDSIPALQGICNGYGLNVNLGKTIAADGSALVADNAALPCGHFAGMFPVTSISVSYTNGTSLPVSTLDLANFSPESQNKNLSEQWIDLNNPLFQSWMEQNTMPSSQKLIGRITSTFEGQVDISIAIPEGIARGVGGVTLILEEVRVFGHMNLSFVMCSFIESVTIFIFAFVLHYYGKLIKEEIGENQLKEKGKKGESKEGLQRRSQFKEADKPLHMIQLKSRSEREGDENCVKNP